MANPVSAVGSASPFAFESLQLFFIDSRVPTFFQLSFTGERMSTEYWLTLSVKKMTVQTSPQLFYSDKTKTKLSEYI